jgi:hypothetical protein
MLSRDTIRIDTNATGPVLRPSRAPRDHAERHRKL